MDLIECRRQIKQFFALMYRMTLCQDMFQLFISKIWEDLTELFHAMNNFLKILKVKTVLFVYASMVFKFFGCPVTEKMEIQVFACLKIWRSLLKPSSKCLLRHSGSRLWFCKLFHKPEIMVKNLKNFEAIFGYTFQNHWQMIGCRLFRRLNWGFQFQFSLRCRQSWKFRCSFL